jgi:hypothetical protein
LKAYRSYFFFFLFLKKRARLNNRWLLQTQCAARTTFRRDDSCVRAIRVTCVRARLRGDAAHNGMKCMLCATSSDLRVEGLVDDGTRNGSAHIHRPSSSRGVQLGVHTRQRTTVGLSACSQVTSGAPRNRLRRPTRSTALDVAFGVHRHTTGDGRSRGAARVCTSQPRQSAL